MFLVILAGVGITYLVVHSAVLESFREFVSERSEFFGTLLSCMMCAGFWIGVLMSLFLGGSPIIVGSVTSLLGHIINVCLESLEVRTEYYEMILSRHAKAEYYNLETSETVEESEIN